MLKALKLIVASAMLLLALPLIGSVLYFLQGSLEEFPTDEQQDKIRTVFGVCIAILLPAEVILFLIYRKIKNQLVRNKFGFK